MNNVYKIDNLDNEHIGKTLETHISNFFFPLFKLSKTVLG